ncbi:MAG: hypothetical protein SNF33_02445 [Candidatus Algichlamydia australiensis]|nr:hypothetical protein [Chlamydiales bacterium]
MVDVGSQGAIKVIYEGLFCSIWVDDKGLLIEDVVTGFGSIAVAIGYCSAVSFGVIGVFPDGAIRSAFFDNLIVCIVGIFCSLIQLVCFCNFAAFSIVFVGDFFKGIGLSCILVSAGDKVILLVVF